MKTLLRKVLWKRQPKWQLRFAGVSWFLGLLFMMLAGQLYHDLSRQLHLHDDIGDHLIVSSKVSMADLAAQTDPRIRDIFGSRFGGTSLDSSDLLDLLDNPNIIDAAPVLVNHFRFGSDLSQQLGVPVDYLFLEAVPDRFLDTIPDDWQWEVGSSFVPVMVSKTMLDIYNLNVSFLIGQPQIPESLISGIPLRLYILDQTSYRPRIQAEFGARILAFSRRIPTLVVPFDFMVWANATYGDSTQAAIHKLMLKVRNAHDPELHAFLASKGLEANEESGHQGIIRQVAGLTLLILGSIGAGFALLAMIIFMLSLELFANRSRDKVRLLIQLGYHGQNVSNSLLLSSLRFSLTVTACVFIAYFPLAWLMHRKIGSQLNDFAFQPAWLAWLLAIIAITSMITLNWHVSRRSVRSLNQQHRGASLNRREHAAP